jgi:AcrR family transcriptional regulator
MAPDTDVRIQRTRACIREALVALVAEEGLPGITHHRVAERAGIGRATVYRHLPTVEDLVREAMDCMDVALPEADDDTFESQLIAIGRKFARDVNDPAVAGLVAGMIERAQWDQESRERQTAMIGRMVEQLRVAAGDLARAIDIDLVVSQVLGPLFFRALVAGQPVDDEFVAQVVRRALAPPV